MYCACSQLKIISCLAQAGACCHSRHPKRGLITDIVLWNKCFTTLAAALSARYPDKAPNLMAYLQTTVRASRNFGGLAWALYDAAYRRQAANNCSLDWAIPDPTLYNEAFTGRARVILVASSACRTATRLTIAPMPQMISDSMGTGNHPPDVGQPDSCCSNLPSV